MVSRSKTITNDETGCKENSRDLAHFQSHTQEKHRNTQETQNAFLAATFLSTARKDPRERKGGINCFSKQTAY